MDATEIYDEQFAKLNSPPEFREFFDCRFQDCNFQDADLSYKKFSDCELVGCNISVANLNNATFRSCKFSRCKLVGINWSATNRFEDIQFDNCVLSSSIMMNLNLRGFSFKESVLKDVDFSEANLQKVEFDTCDLSGATFRNTDLSGGDLSSSTSYEIDPTFNKIKKTKFRLPEAISLLNGLGIELVD